MKQSQKVWIKGNANRGKEVIRILEDLGGENIDSCQGHDPNMIYFINHNEDIDTIEITHVFANIIMEQYKEIELPKIKDKYKFKSFDKVLTRDHWDEEWVCNIFSHINNDREDYQYICIADFASKYCIPYNEETAKLLGTTIDYE